MTPTVGQKVQYLEGPDKSTPATITKVHNDTTVDLTLDRGGPGYPNNPGDPNRAGYPNNPGGGPVDPNRAGYPNNPGGGPVDPNRSTETKTSVVFIASGPIPAGTFGWR